jgi:hypothetical protein
MTNQIQIKLLLTKVQGIFVTLNTFLVMTNQNKQLEKARNVGTEPSIDSSFCLTDFIKDHYPFALAFFSFFFLTTLLHTDFVAPLPAMSKPPQESYKMDELSYNDPDHDAAEDSLKKRKSSPAYQPPPLPSETKSSPAVVCGIILFVLICGAESLIAICETNGRHLCTQQGGRGSVQPQTQSPTQNPTFSPTPLETNPTKPDFSETKSALQAKINAVTVVADPLLLTSSPTVKPTPNPTVKVPFNLFLFRSPNIYFLCAVVKKLAT